MADPDLTPPPGLPFIEDRSAGHAIHLVAVACGVGLFVAAVTNQPVRLSDQLLQLPAPGVPVLRAVVALVGFALLVWGLWGLFTPAWFRPGQAASRTALPAVLRVRRAPAGELGAGRFQPSITVRLRGQRAVVADLNTAVPAISVWFEIHNHSDADVVLDRITVDVWAVQPALNGVMADRRSVACHSSVGDIHFKGTLVPAAVEMIRREMAQTGSRSNYTVYATAYFDTPQGPIEIRPDNLFWEIPAS